MRIHTRWVLPIIGVLVFLGARTQAHRDYNSHSQIVTDWDPISFLQPDLSAATIAEALLAAPAVIAASPVSLLLPGGSYSDIDLFSYFVAPFVLVQWWLIGWVVDASLGLSQHPFDPPRTRMKVVSLAAVRVLFASIVLLGAVIALRQDRFRLGEMTFLIVLGVWGFGGSVAGHIWWKRLSESPSTEC